MKYDPGIDFTYRNKLIRICMDRGIPLEKFYEIAGAMKGRSHEERERMAREAIAVIESGVYDSCPRHFYHKTEWMTTINRLSGEDRLSYETVRPVVKDMLRYCLRSRGPVETVLSSLRTEEHLRQMYNWLMEQHLVPDAPVCIEKARKIDAALSENGQ